MSQATGDLSTIAGQKAASALDGTELLSGYQNGQVGIALATALIPYLLSAFKANGGIVLQSVTNGITAFAGGGQGSAVALTSVINRVTTVGTAADSVKLPAAKAGASLSVINAAAANAMAVFPATGDAINALSANASLSVAANKTVMFECAVDGTWHSILTA